LQEGPRPCSAVPHRKGEPLAKSVVFCCSRDSSITHQGAKLNFVTSAGETPLHVACANGSIRCVELLLHKGCDIDAVDKSGRGALHYAVESGNYDIVLWIMDECRSTDVPDSAGVTPLHIAIQNDFVDIGEPTEQFFNSALP